MSFIKRYWKSLFWIGLIFALSVFKGDKIPVHTEFKIPHLDKIGHFGMYFILTFLLAYDFFAHNNSLRKNSSNMLLVMMVSIFFGVAMELLQHFIFVWRSGDIYDLFANIAGSVVAIPFFLYSRYRFSFIP